MGVQQRAEALADSIEGLDFDGKTMYTVEVPTTLVLHQVTSREDFIERVTYYWMGEYVRRFQGSYFKSDELYIGDSMTKTDDARVVDSEPMED